MTTRYDILGDISRHPADAADRALLAALDLSDNIDDQIEIVHTIIRRRQTASTVGLIGRLNALPQQVQAVVCEQAERLATGLRSAVICPTRQTRANALNLIAASRLPALAGAAAAGLGDVDEQLVNEAAGALAGCVGRYLTDPRPSRPREADTPEQRAARAAWAAGQKQLIDAVRDALISYPAHRRLAVLDCAVRLADELSDVILGLLSQPGNQIAAAMIEMVTQSLQLGRSAAPFYYLALSAPATRMRFAGRIGAMSDRGLIVELIAQSHRADDVETARGLAAVRQFVMFTRPGWPEQIPDEFSAGLVRWIRAIGVEPAARADWLATLALEGSAAQRDEAVTALCRWNVPETTAALARIVRESRLAGVAEVAAAELNKRGCNELPDLMRQRLADPDQAVRELAMQHVGQTTFERFWEQYPRLTDEVRQAIGAKLRRVVPDLADRLAARLADNDPVQRLQALRVVDQVAMRDELAEAICVCCSDTDVRVRSAAVRLLSSAAGPQGDQLAQAALADPDPRVRANAIEALEQRGPRSAAEDLADMLDDRDNRIRANAIKALMAMELPAARQSLQQMLGDASADHRLSALWVVEQVGWLKPAEQVLRLARHDPDRRVRRRALRALGELRRLYRLLDRPRRGRVRAPVPAGPANVYT